MRKYRTPEQIIADLEAKIAQVRARAERQKARKDPATRAILAALKSIDTAHGLTRDAVTKQAMEEARAVLVILTQAGVPASGDGVNGLGGRRVRRPG